MSTEPRPNSIPIELKEEMVVDDLKKRKEKLEEWCKAIRHPDMSMNYIQNQK